MMAAMIEVFCDSFDAVPRRILLDIDCGFRGKSPANPG
jgi:hypothetical protein